MATCSISVRVDSTSPNTPPLALMTNTLPLYMRMYGAALRRARTATEGSERSTTAIFLEVINDWKSGWTERSAAKQPVKDRHLHDHAIERFTDHDAARTVEHFIGHRDITPNWQAMHEMT